MPLHSSGQPAPHGPGLQPTLHGLPPHSVRQRALPGLQTALQNVVEQVGSQTQPAAHGSQRKLLQRVKGHKAAEHWSGQPNPQIFPPGHVTSHCGCPPHL